MSINMTTTNFNSIFTKSKKADSKWILRTDNYQVTQIGWFIFKFYKMNCSRYKYSIILSKEMLKNVKTHQRNSEMSPWRGAAQKPHITHLLGINCWSPCNSHSSTWMTVWSKALKLLDAKKVGTLAVPKVLWMFRWPTTNSSFLGVLTKTSTWYLAVTSSKKSCSNQIPSPVCDQSIQKSRFCLRKARPTKFQFL